MWQVLGKRGRSSHTPTASAHGRRWPRRAGAPGRWRRPACGRRCKPSPPAGRTWSEPSAVARDRRHEVQLPYGPTVEVDLGDRSQRRLGTGPRGPRGAGGPDGRTARTTRAREPAGCPAGRRRGDTRAASAPNTKGLAGRAATCIQRASSRRWPRAAPTFTRSRSPTLTPPLVTTACAPLRGSGRTPRAARSRRRPRCRGRPRRTPRRAPGRAGVVPVGVADLAGPKGPPGADSSSPVEARPPPRPGVHEHPSRRGRRARRMCAGVSGVADLEHRGSPGRDVFAHGRTAVRPRPRGSMTTVASPSSEWGLLDHAGGRQVGAGWDRRPGHDAHRLHRAPGQLVAVLPGQHRPHDGQRDPAASACRADRTRSRPSPSWRRAAHAWAATDRLGQHAAGRLHERKNQAAVPAACSR